MDRSIYENDVRDYRANVDKALLGLRNVKIFDLARALCDKTTCPIKMGDELIYIDTNHLNSRGSKLVAEHFDF